MRLLHGARRALRALFFPLAFVFAASLPFSIGGCGKGAPTAPASSSAQSIEKGPAYPAAVVSTSTGYVYPIDKEITSDLNFGAYGAPSCGGNYNECGIRHTGADIMCNIGTPVRAAGSGTVVKIGTGGAGTGNFYVLIQTAGIVYSNNMCIDKPSVFVYGHIRGASGTSYSPLPIHEGQYVTKGTIIGYVGPYSGGNHVHFGVHPGVGIDFLSRGWGRLSTSASGNDYNGFTEPIHWIRTVSG